MLLVLGESPGNNVLEKSRFLGMAGVMLPELQIPGNRDRIAES